MFKINSAYERVLVALRAYYFALAGLVNIFGLGQLKSYSPEFKPAFLSVAVVFGEMNYRSALLTTSLLVMGSCLCAGLLVTRWWPKLAVFLSLLFYAAVANSAGGVTHLYQFWLWSSFALLCSPGVRGDFTRKAKMRVLLSWWGAQSIVLMLYGLSGLWKLIGFFIQLYDGESGIFSVAGLSYHLASEIIRAGADPLLKTWLLEQEGLQPVMALTIGALQLACFVGIFKSWLRPYLGIGLIGFHLSTFLFLSISYPTNTILIPVLFLLTPNALFSRKGQ